VPTMVYPSTHVQHVSKEYGEELAALRVNSALAPQSNCVPFAPALDPTMR